MAGTPRISVVVPVYNGERFIQGTLEALLAQSVTDFEVIVSDNASTDATAAIVKSISDPRVRYRRNETNIGAVGNWNAGLAEASGRYLKLLHADDRIYPTCLERQAGVLDDPANAGVALVTSRKDVIKDDGERLMSRGITTEGRIPGAEAVRRTIRTGTNFIGEPSGVMMRAEAYRAAGEFDATAAYLVDLDMWWRVLEHGDLYNIAEPLYAFRVHGGSWSSALAKQQTADFVSLVKRRVASGEVSASRSEIAMGTALAWASTQGRRLVYWRLFRGTRPSGG